VRSGAVADGLFTTEDTEEDTEITEGGWFAGVWPAGGQTPQASILTAEEPRGEA
jgi:hypothetical protein